MSQSSQTASEGAKPTPQWLLAYERFLKNVFNPAPLVQFVPIDFSRPWWHVYGAFPVISILTAFASVLLMAIEFSLSLVIAWLFENDLLWTYGPWLAGLIVVGHGIHFFIRRIAFVRIFSLEESIRIFGMQRLLTADPIHHTLSETGKNVAKVNRAAESVFTFWAYGVMSGVWIPFSLVFALLAFGSLHPYLAIVSLVGMCVTVIPLLTFRLFSYKFFRKKVIESSDNATAVMTEGLHQATFVRAMGATQEMLQRHRQRRHSAVTTEAISITNNSLLLTYRRIFFVLAIAAFVTTSFYLVEQGAITVPVGLAAIASFFTIGDSLTNADQYIYEMINQAYEAEEAFQYINTFGTQTYPVLPGDVIDTQLTSQ